MKLSHVFAVVVLLHVAVVSTLFIFPGCQGVENVAERVRPQGDRAVDGTPFGSPHSQADGTTASTSTYTAPGAVQTSNPNLVSPTKPTWNIASSDQPATIQGEAVYEEMSFNAVNPELNGVETIEIEETVVTTLSTQQTYTVKKGDNLTKIAKAQGIELTDLMAANGLKKDSIIRIGQTLIIPADSLAGPVSPSAPTLSPAAIDREGTAYKVQNGDTLGGIAKRYGTSVTALRGANSLSSDTIYVGQELLIPSGSASVPPPPSVAPAAVSVGSGEGTYVVQSGDTLGAIANRYGITVRDLAARNNISDPRKLRAGQTLVVPQAGSSTSTSRPSTATAPKPAPAAAPSAPAPRPAAPAPVPAPVPAPSQPVRGGQETMDLDNLNLDDIPVVPVETSE